MSVHTGKLQKLVLLYFFQPAIPTVIGEVVFSIQKKEGRSSSVSISSSGSGHNPFVKDTWTREFCCLPYTFSNTTPSSIIYPVLVGAGFVKKKIEFSSSDKHDNVVKRITDVYPRLAKCGGFTFHKLQDGGTKRLLQKGN